MCAVSCRVCTTTKIPRINSISKIPVVSLKTQGQCFWHVGVWRPLNWLVCPRVMHGVTRNIHRRRWVRSGAFSVWHLCTYRWKLRAVNRPTSHHTISDRGPQWGDSQLRINNTQFSNCDPETPLWTATGVQCLN